MLAVAVGHVLLAVALLGKDDDDGPDVNSDLWDYLMDGKYRLLGKGCLANPRLSVNITPRGFMDCAQNVEQNEVFTYVDGLCEVAEDAFDEDCGNTTNVLNVYHRRFTPLRYDNTTPPPGKVVIAVSATILKINFLDIATQTYSFGVFLRHEWHDSRLRWDPKDFLVERRVFNKHASIWMPDTFLSSAQEVSSALSEAFVDISSDGRVLWSRRLFVTSVCEMNFVYYPFERIVCMSDLESFTYPADVLSFTQSSVFDAVVIDNQCDSNLPDNEEACGTIFKAGPYLVGEEVRPVIVEKSHAGRKFSAVRWIIRFEREWFAYLWTTYLSLWLITCLSIASCWIDNQDPNTRFALGITTLLVMITEMASFRQDLPDVSYVTAMDTYFVVTFFFGVSNVVSYILIHRAHVALGTQRTRGVCRGKAHIAEKEAREQEAREKQAQGISPRPQYSNTLTVHSPMLRSGTEPFGPLKRSMNITAEMRKPGWIDDKAEPPELNPKQRACLEQCFDTFRIHRYSAKPDTEEQDDDDSEKKNESLRKTSRSDRGVILYRDLKACFVYLDVPPSVAVELSNAFSGVFDDEATLSFAHFSHIVVDCKILPRYGIRAIQWMGWCGVTERSINKFDSIWRVCAVVGYILFNFLWFILVFTYR